MKKTLKASMKALAIAAIATTITIGAHAQGNPGGPGSNGSTTFGNGSLVNGTSTSVPFDGGMSLVLAASGIGYAAKKLKKKK